MKKPSILPTQVLFSRLELPGLVSVLRISVCFTFCALSETLFENMIFYEILIACRGVVNSCRWVELSDTCSTVTGSDNISCSGLQVLTDFTLIPDTSDPSREWFKAPQEGIPHCFCFSLLLGITVELLPAYVFVTPQGHKRRAGRRRE